MSDVMKYSKASVSRRIAAFLIDHIIIIFIVIIPFLISFSDIMNDLSKMFDIFNQGMLIAMTLYLLKDCINGISVGKWFMGIKVRELSDPDKRPNVIRLIIRNIFTYIWPVEVGVLLLSSDKRKIGDKIAKTEVFRAPVKTGKVKKLAIAISLFIIFVLSIFVITIQTMKADDSYQTAIEYIEDSSEIQDLTGGIIGYGAFPLGSINITNGIGSADMSIKVKGRSKDIRVKIILSREPEKLWQVKDVRY